MEEGSPLHSRAGTPLLPSFTSSSAVGSRRVNPLTRPSFRTLIEDRFGFSSTRRVFAMFFGNFVNPVSQCVILAGCFFSKNNLTRIL